MKTHHLSRKAASLFLAGFLGIALSLPVFHSAHAQIGPPIYPDTSTTAPVTPPASTGSTDRTPLSPDSPIGGGTNFPGAAPAPEGTAWTPMPGDTNTVTGTTSGATYTGTYCTTYSGSINAETSKISDILNFFTCFIQRSIIPLLFAMAVAVFVWGMVKFISNNDSSEREQGQQFMLWGIIALAVMFSVWGLVRLLGDTFKVNNVIPSLPVNQKGS